MLPLLTLIPEVMVAEDLDPLLFCMLVRLFVASVSVSDVGLFTVELTKNRMIAFH